MNENETHAPCEAYATAVIPPIGNYDARLGALTEQLTKLSMRLDDLDMHLAVLERTVAHWMVVNLAADDAAATAEVVENSEPSAEEIAEATASEPAPTYEEEEAADPAEEREHYCHGLGKWYTRREWHALIDAINAGEIDYAAYTYKGYKYGYDDRCLNPTPVVNRCNHDGTMQVRVWLAEGPQGWSYGMKVKVPGLTFQKPCVCAIGRYAIESGADALALAIDELARFIDYRAADDHVCGLLDRHKSSEACKKAVAEYRKLVDRLMDTGLADYLTTHNIDIPE